VQWIGLLRSRWAPGKFGLWFRASVCTVSGIKTGALRLKVAQAVRATATSNILMT
jgi:hypothetical protein